MRNFLLLAGFVFVLTACSSTPQVPQPQDYDRTKWQFSKSKPEGYPRFSKKQVTDELGTLCYDVVEDWVPEDYLGHPAWRRTEKRDSFPCPGQDRPPAER